MIEFFSVIQKINKFAFFGQSRYLKLYPIHMFIDLVVVREKEEPLLRSQMTIILKLNWGGLLIWSQQQVILLWRTLAIVAHATCSIQLTRCAQNSFLKYFFMQYVSVYELKYAHLCFHRHVCSYPSIDWREASLFS